MKIKLLSLLSLLAVQQIHAAEVAQVSQGTSAYAIAQALRPLAIINNNGEINSAAISPDGKYIVTTSLNTAPKIWNAQTGEFIRELSARNTMQARFSPDGKKVAVISSDIIIFDTETGNVEMRLAFRFSHPGAGISTKSLAFSADGTKIISGEEYGTKIWNTANGKEIIHILSGDTDAVAFSPDSNQVLTSSKKSERQKRGIEKTVMLWDASNGQLIHTFDGQHWGASFSPDGSQIIMCSDSNVAEVFNTQALNRTHWLKVVPPSNIFTPEEMQSAAFSPDGEIVTVSLAEHARLWDAQTRKIKSTFDTSTPNAEMSSIHPDSFARDGKFVPLLRIKPHYDLANIVEVFNIGQLEIKEYFKNKLLPLKQQSLLVTLDALSRQKNGRPIKKSDLVADPRQDTSALFKGMPQRVIDALKRVYKIDEDVFI